MSPYEYFAQLRRDSAVDARAFADEVCRMDLFLDRFALARTVLLNGASDGHAMEDAAQQAFIDVNQYLVETRGSDFVSDTDGALGHWFYGLIRRNMWWRFYKALRSRRHHESVDRAEQCMSYQLYFHAWQAFVGLLTTLTDTEQSILLDAMDGVEVAVSAAKHGISARTISRYRKASYQRIREAIQELL